MHFHTNKSTQLTYIFNINAITFNAGTKAMAFYCLS